MDEPKEWVSITHTAAGVTAARVVLFDGVNTARWAVKCYGSETAMREGIALARSGAKRALSVMQEVPF